MSDDRSEASFRYDDLSKDEYEIALQEGIEDETLLEQPAPKKFTISSYGADYTVDTLVKRMRTGVFKVPEFQRKFVWTLKHASKFIESLLMGLPVPGIFLYKEAETNEHLIIDGQQRLKTLEAFYSEMLKDRRFRLVGVREPWAGKSYSELDPSDALKLDDSIVHATIFKQDKPQDVLDSIYFVFERINTGGIRLSPQEIRNCIAIGPFIKLVKLLNANESWRQIFGSINNRAKDEELIVRFLALSKVGDGYERPMAKFLNDFSADMNRADVEVLRRVEQIFEKTTAAVAGAIPRPFRPVRSLNAAVFDSVMVGVAHRLNANPQYEPSRLLTAYELLLANSEYRYACERATADEENVRLRLTLAVEAFAEV